jgi:hypothetical protein
MLLTPDGTSGIYVDRDVSDRASALVVPQGQELSTTDLDRLGRAFIANHLSDVVQVAPGEDLVSLRTASRKIAYQSTDGTDTGSGVSGGIVVFGRTVNGVPVVGGGSRITIAFANDGSVESFQYDWPSYRPSAQSAQGIVGIDAILQRLQKVALGPGESPASASAARSGALTTTGGVQLQDLDCGYFDPGVQTRDPSAPVQTACAYHVVRQLSASGRHGMSGAVPAGSSVEADGKWREALMLRGTAPTIIVPPDAPGP